jgi:XapX domain-containing protein
MDTLQTFVLGGLIGGIFAAFGLPAPVPPTFAGFMGIVGLFIGAFIVTLVRK